MASNRTRPTLEIQYSPNESSSTSQDRTPQSPGILRASTAHPPVTAKSSLSVPVFGASIHSPRVAASSDSLMPANGQVVAEDVLLTGLPSPNASHAAYSQMEAWWRQQGPEPSTFQSARRKSRHYSRTTRLTTGGDCEPLLQAEPGYTDTKALREEQEFALRRAKLKAVNRTSALLAGFAMVAMVEVSLEVDKEYPTLLLVTFCIVTTLLVVVHLISLMISTCLLPNMEVYLEYREFSNYESPDRPFKKHIEVAWILSTGIGLVLMMMDIGLLIGIKFFPMDDAFKWVMTSGGIIVVPATIIFVYFSANYYQKLLLSHFYKQQRQMDSMGKLMADITDDNAARGGHRGLQPSQSIITDALPRFDVERMQSPHNSLTSGMDLEQTRFSPSSVGSVRHQNERTDTQLIRPGSGSTSMNEFQDCFNAP